MLNAREEELANTASTELTAEDLPSESDLTITQDSLCELLGIPETRWSTEEITMNNGMGEMVAVAAESAPSLDDIRNMIAARRSALLDKLHRAEKQVRAIQEELIQLNRVTPAQPRSVLHRLGRKRNPDSKNGQIRKLLQGTWMTGRQVIDATGDDLAFRRIQQMFINGQVVRRGERGSYEYTAA